MTTAPRPPVARRELLTVLALTLLFALVLTTWAMVTPPLHGPDELANIDAAIHLATGQPWPAAGDLHYVQGLLAQNVPALPPPAATRVSFGEVIGDGTLNDLVNPMSQHPPTYFLVQAVVAHLLDFTTRRWDVVVLAMRLVDVLVVLPVPLLVWAAVRRATRSPRTAVAATVTLFAVPQLAQLGASVSVWAPVITAGALATWLMVRLLTGDRSWWTVLALGGALAVGTALMAGGLLAVPAAVVAVLAPTRGVGPDRRGRVLRALVTVAVPAVTTGWWYVLQTVRTGTPQPDAFPATTQPWPADESPAPTQFVGAFWNGLSETFWGRFGRYEYPLSAVVVDTFTVVALAAVVWAAARRGGHRRTMAVAGVFPATALLVVLVRDWATYSGHLGVTVNQGRFLFPAIAALLVLQAVAWRALVTTPSTRTRLARVTLVVSGLVALGGLGLLYAGAYEQFRFPPSAAGLALLGTTVPYGLHPVALLLVLTAVVGAAAAVLTWRTVGSAGTASRADRPRDAVPLDSPPTDAPTQRNHP